MSYADLTQRRTYSRVWLTSLRAKRKALGVCVQCGTESKGKYRCRRCRLAQAAYYYRKVAA